MSILPTDPKARKDAPIARGVLDYFPRALAAVAELSRIGNEQHNPGQPMHWNKAKSTDHADCIVRHLIERGTVDGDGVRHAAKVAWRALALLETELEAAQQPEEISPDASNAAGSRPETAPEEVSPGAIIRTVEPLPAAKSCDTCRHQFGLVDTEKCGTCSRSYSNWQPRG